MTNWTDLDATMPRFIRENPWILTHDGQCCVLDVVMVTDAMYEEITQLRAELAAERELADRLTEDDVKWIVNDNAELGVMVRGQLFFLYKGRSLQYGALDDDPTKPPKHDDGSPMKWRPVFKREFGECVHPINHSDYSRIGTVSLCDSDDWQDIPAAYATRRNK